MTNHFTPDHISGCSKDEAVRKYTACFNDLKECSKKNGITAIFGMELRFTENINDYLLYGVSEEDVAGIYEFVDKGIDYFYRNYKNNKILIFQAHPFRDGLQDSHDVVQVLKNKDFVFDIFENIVLPY